MIFHEKRLDKRATLTYYLAEAYDEHLNPALTYCIDGFDTKVGIICDLKSSDGLHWFHFQQGLLCSLIAHKMACRLPVRFAQCV